MLLSPTANIPSHGNTDMEASLNKKSDRIVHDLDAMQTGNITQGIGFKATRRRASTTKPALSPIKTDLDNKRSSMDGVQDLKLTRRRAARAVS